MRSIDFQQHSEHIMKPCRPQQSNPLLSTTLFTRSTRLMKRSISLALMPVLLLIAAGCQRSDNPVAPGPGNAPSALNDAAVSVSNALSRNNGGAFDQIGDMALITSAANVQGEAGVMFDRYSMDSVV